MRAYRSCPKGCYDIWASYQDQPFPRKIGRFQFRDIPHVLWRAIRPTTSTDSKHYSVGEMWSWQASMSENMSFKSLIYQWNYIIIPLERQVTKRGHYITNPVLLIGISLKISMRLHCLMRNVAITKVVCFVALVECNWECHFPPKKTEPQEKKLHKAGGEWFCKSSSKWLDHPTTLEGCSFFLSKLLFFKWK